LGVGLAELLQSFTGNFVARLWSGAIGSSIKERASRTTANDGPNEQSDVENRGPIDAAQSQVHAFRAVSEMIELTPRTMSVHSEVQKAKLDPSRDGWRCDTRLSYVM
jgi:hypothetical protein